MVKYKLYFLAKQTKIQMTIDWLKATPNSMGNKIKTQEILQISYIITMAFSKENV